LIHKIISFDFSAPDRSDEGLKIFYKKFLVLLFKK